MASENKKILVFPDDIDKKPHIKFRAYSFQTYFQDPNNIELEKDYKFTLGLYIPNDTKLNLQSNWGSLEGVIGSSVVSDVKRLTKGNYQDAFKNLSNKSLQIVGNQAYNKTINSGNNIFTNIAKSELAKQGLAYNPYEFLSYQGPDYISMNFSFNLVPEFQKDADTINKMMLLLKTAKAPNVVGNFLSFPLIFDIVIDTSSETSQAKDNRNNGSIVSDIVTTYGMALENVELGFSGDSGSNDLVFMEDGNPLEYTLSMSFKSIQKFANYKNIDEVIRDIF